VRIGGELDSDAGGADPDQPALSGAPDSHTDGRADTDWRPYGGPHASFAADRRYLQHCL
jgi:hypothetical protein